MNGFKGKFYIFWNAIMTGLKRSGNLDLQQSILHRNFCHKSILNEKPVQFYSQQNISCWFSKWVIYKKIYSENMPNFCWLGFIPFQKISKFPRNLFTFRRKSTKFGILELKTSQPLLPYFSLPLRHSLGRLWKFPLLDKSATIFAQSYKSALVYLNAELRMELWKAASSHSSLVDYLVQVI